VNRFFSLWGECLPREWLGPGEGAVIVRSFIYTDEGRTILSSYDLERITKNADGGVTLYVGPEAPKGLESNSSGVVVDSQGPKLF